MHCDTISRLCDMLDTGAEDIRLRKSGLHIDLEKLRKSGYLLQNFALFVDIGRHDDPWLRFCRLADYYDEQLAENSDVIAPVLSFSDIEKNLAEGKLSSLLTVEEGAVCGGRIERLRAIYARGVRMMTLTWNYENELGCPNISAGSAGLLSSQLTTPEAGRGLTEKGMEFIFEMEKLGMIIDVSHFSDAGFWDIAECASKPFVASHSNARSVSPCVRNLTDDMIRALAEKGGVTGLNFCMDFLKLNRTGKKDELMDALCAHARHITVVGGEDVLGLGSDFDGIDTNGDLPDATCIPSLFDALKCAGFTPRQLDKIASGNVLRVYKDTLA